MVKPYNRLAYPKINLSLNVTGKRDDGYHLLHSVAAFVHCDDADNICAIPSIKITLTIDGPYSDGLSTTNNLVMRAAEAMHIATNSSQGAALHLTKNVPVASGIGGGSSDAAATLHALNDMWQCGLSINELATIAAPLGADVPLCVYAQASLMQGIGHHITPLPYVANIRRYHALLVNPSINVHTPDIFAELSPDTWHTPVIYDITRPVTAATLQAMSNDLQRPASMQCPDIHHVLNALQDDPTIITMRMSGSGATCFALYHAYDTIHMHAHRDALRKAYPHWWITCGALH